MRRREGGAQVFLQSCLYLLPSVVEKYANVLCFSQLVLSMITVFGEYNKAFFEDSYKVQIVFHSRNCEKTGTREGLWDHLGSQAGE